MHVTFNSYDLEDTFRETETAVMMGKMFFKNKQYTRNILTLPCLFLMGALIACTFEVDVLEPTPTPNSENEIQEIDLASAGEMNEKEGTQRPPSEADVGCQGSPLAGLVFASRDQNGKGLWQIGACGGLVHLSTQSNVQISPGGKHALYTQNDDIWIVNLLSGDIQNLTNTPDRIENGPQWWPGNDDLIVFGSWSLGEDLGPTSGYLTLVSTDGSDYRVLVDQASNANPAPQPSGSMIAYDLGGTAWIYHLDEDKSESFDGSLYGLNIQKGMKIGSPSWSPDGKKLTWWISGVFSPPIDGSVALGIFDLDARNVELLHPYSSMGTGGGQFSPVWSPNGEQLAVVTLGEAHKVDLWVIDADSGEEHLLGFASNPIWHPEGSALVYQAWSDDVIKLIEVDTWTLQTLDLPPRSTPVDWLDTILELLSAGQQPTPNAAPHFGPAIYFGTSPKMADSRTVFPYGTPEIFAIWSYRNMQAGLTVRREWYLDGDLWLEREETWDYAKYGAEGILTDISIYDFEQGLQPGRYQLRLYIDGQEQPLGLGEKFSSANFEISAPIDISPQVSPDYSQMAIVESPGTLIIQDVETQEKRTLLTVEEISSLTWYPNGKYILFSVRDRSGQLSPGTPRFGDELRVINLETGESYPFQDQFGQHQGEGLHHPFVSPDGLYVAAIEGSGWADACFVDSKLWVKVIGFTGDRLQEVYSHYEYSFEVNPEPGNGEMYVKHIIGWDSPTRLKVELGWTCATENLDGVYVFDMSTMTAEKIGASG